VRDILINNPAPLQNFDGSVMKIYRLDTANELMSLDEVADSEFQLEEMTIMIMDFTMSYASPFVTGYMYNIHFDEGIDFATLGIMASQYFTVEDLGVILRFNYTLYRETFDIYTKVGTTLGATPFADIGSKPLVATCNMGDFHNDLTNKLLYICISGKSKTTYEFLSVASVYCRDRCDTIGQVPVDNFFTNWSDGAAWVGGVVPTVG
jgi:hypothetical protein